MSNNKSKKSVTQRIKDALENGKKVTENQVLAMGGSPRFLAKRVAEFRANGLTINTTKNSRKETAYELV